MVIELVEKMRVDVSPSCKMATPIKFSWYFLSEKSNRNPKEEVQNNCRIKLSLVPPILALPTQQKAGNL